MATVATCLSDIGKVRQVASGQEQAYVARSRLARLILRVTNVAQRLSDPPGRAARILAICKRLDACRRSATHASEPLDERWRSTWQEIMVHLDALELLLRSADGEMDR